MRLPLIDRRERPRFPWEEPPKFDAPSDHTLITIRVYGPYGYLEKPNDYFSYYLPKDMTPREQVERALSIALGHLRNGKRPD